MADAEKLVDFTRERLGRLDILVANAGIWNEKPEPIEQLSEREWDEMIRVNLKSVYAVIHFAVPHMIAQRGWPQDESWQSAPRRASAANRFTRTTEPQKGLSSVW